MITMSLATIAHGQVFIEEPRPNIRIAGITVLHYEHLMLEDGISGDPNWSLYRSVEQG
jgi:hypothetical protein